MTSASEEARARLAAAMDHVAAKANELVESVEGLDSAFCTAVSYDDVDYPDEDLFALRQRLAETVFWVTQVRKRIVEEKIT